MSNTGRLLDLDLVYGREPNGSKSLTGRAAIGGAVPSDVGSLVLSSAAGGSLDGLVTSCSWEPAIELTALHFTADPGKVNDPLAMRLFEDYVDGREVMLAIQCGGNVTTYQRLGLGERGRALLGYAAAANI